MQARDAGEGGGGRRASAPPCPFLRGTRGQRCPFRNIIGIIVEFAISSRDKVCGNEAAGEIKRPCLTFIAYIM
jgi:hypothetical protein